MKVLVVHAHFDDFEFTAGGTFERWRRKFGADFRGRVLLVNYWATWCSPCVAEMPSLDRLEAALGGTDFAVLPIASDRAGLRVVEPFYAKAALKRLPIYLDQDMKFTRGSGVRGLPVFDPAVSVATVVPLAFSNVITGTLPVGNVPVNVTSPPAATGCGLKPVIRYWGVVPPLVPTAKVVIPSST